MYKLTSTAERDLYHIGEFTEARWGMARSDAYLLELHNCFQQLIDFPEKGRKRDDIAPGHRSVIAGEHTVFYHFNGNYIEIVRVLHQHMDYSRHRFN